jgi:CheY-like chemotaxis protein
MTNARRHADARRVPPAGHEGIAGMRERTDVLGGRLEIRSRTGAGTTIRFEASLTMQAWDSSRPVRVLLVEDHASTREAIAAEFEPHPEFEIVGQAASLAEAREVLAGADVVILDLGLPDGSGAELLPEIRAVNPNARAVVLSASYDRSLHTRAVEHGAAAVLDKMTHLGQMAQTVRRLLAGERLVPSEDEDG